MSKKTDAVSVDDDTYEDETPVATSRNDKRSKLDLNEPEKMAENEVNNEEQEQEPEEKIQQEEEQPAEEPFEEVKTRKRKTRRE